MPTVQLIVDGEVVALGVNRIIPRIDERLVRSRKDGRQLVYEVVGVEYHDTLPPYEEGLNGLGCEVVRIIAERVS